MGERFLRTVRLLAETYQAFERVSATHVRQLGLTPAQFDVIVTLGNTPGMSCKALGEHTLITKGTLTGVLDRLELRGFVSRIASTADARQIFVRLTPAGEAEFERVFAPHIAHCKMAFADCSVQRLEQFESVLSQLHSRLTAVAKPDSKTNTALGRRAGRKSPVSAAAAARPAGSNMARSKSSAQH
jgi:MarR family transcriptional regulator, 2-MHQ and catechol-resistance regulon repressor